ncbi:hypothetical protein OE88DRAFT_1615358, partial [Heliocybe sulcata]
MKSFPLALLTLAAAVVATPTDLTSNANHVFNAIHSALRQWGSSLNHNGMSYFLATVPEGTQLYHGTSSEAPVAGMEWLAFEPEHSLLFAWRRRGRRPPGEGPAPQVPLAPPEDDELGGYLHTYRTARPLRLLYLDGEAAAKSAKGTLDTQDYVLLNDTEKTGMFREYERAKGMCALAATEWQGRIDGILRMEGGFEIIMCNFSETLAVERITRAKGRGMRDGGQRFDYYRAITARYDGIGGGRVQLNYDAFVTGFDAKYGVHPLFRAVDGRVLPRLVNATAAQVGMMKGDITALVLGPGASFDWQATADMIVGRYASRLEHLVSGALPTLEDVQDEIENTMKPFIDYADRNATAEIQRCAAQFIPSTAPVPSQSMAASAIWAISTRICASLSSASQQPTHPAAVQEIRELMGYLEWTAWKRCGPCDYDRLCMVPIWPFGSAEDFERPQCLNASQMEGRRGYWG